LQSPQGWQKSQFLKKLAGDWFDDSFGAMSDKDERLKLHSAWILEWAELETVFKRKDVAATKAFLSCASDSIRPPYGRETVKMLRPSIIVGTTNETEFLSDTTGNRRFWVVPVTALLLKRNKNRTKVTIQKIFLLKMAKVVVHRKTRRKPLALDTGRKSVAVSTAFNIFLYWLFCRDT